MTDNNREPTETEFKRFLEENPNPHYPDLYDTSTVRTKDGEKLFIEVKARAKSGEQDMYSVALWRAEHKESKGFDWHTFLDHNASFYKGDVESKALEFQKELAAKVKNNTLEELKAV